MTRLKETVTALMDYSRDNKCDINTSAIKLDYEITSGKRSDMTSAELDEARAFVLDNYNVVVDARKSGDYTIMDELIEAW